MEQIEIAIQLEYYTLTIYINDFERFMFGLDFILYNLLIVLYDFEQEYRLYQ